jgi:AraC-like DNA-binding protein
MAIPRLPSSLNVTIKDPRNDLDEVQNRISNFLMPHRMQFINQQRPVNITLRSAQLARASISYFNYRAATVIEIETLRNHYIVEIPLSGVADTCLGRKHFISRKGLAAIISPGTNFRAQWTADCTKLLLIFEREAVERELSNMLQKSVRNPVVFELGMDLESNTGKSLWRTVSYVIKELEQYSSTTDLNAFVCGQLEQLLIWSLLLNQENNYTSVLAEGDLPCEPRFIRRAEEYMRAHCGQPLSIEELCRKACVSPRNLFAGFRKHKRISPLNYFTNLRFEHVHEALKKAGPRETVSRIATKWGFYQLGRFSVEYKRRYGESPSQTLKH